MNRFIWVKKKNALLVLALACTTFGFLMGFSARAETKESLYQKGDKLEVGTGLSDGFSSMTFTCLDTDYRGGYLFVAEEVIPYSLSVRYGTSDNAYTTSDVRTWLNQYFADTLSVAEELLPVKLAETEDGISDRVFCLSLAEVKNSAYQDVTKETWTPMRGMRYYWTRTRRENTANQAYMVQYNGHIASSRVSLTESGIRPAFVLAKEQPDVTQGRIWYEGDTQERVIAGKTYTFRCVDPNYCDAGMNRAGALFLCDSIIGGNASIYDDKNNVWAVSEVRSWLKEQAGDVSGITEAETTVNFTYAGKSSDYQISERKFTKRKLASAPVLDQMFCLSLEEALRYSGWLWKLNGSETDNFAQAGSYSMGYWLRTPAAKEGDLCYAVTYDGRVMPEKVQSERIGIRPAFVAVQE